MTHGVGRQRGHRLLVGGLFLYRRLNALAPPTLEQEQADQTDSAAMSPRVTTATVR